MGIPIFGESAELNTGQIKVLHHIDGKILQNQ